MKRLSTGTMFGSMALLVGAVLWSTPALASRVGLVRMLFGPDTPGWAKGLAGVVLAVAIVIGIKKRQSN